MKTKQLTMKEMSKRKEIVRGSYICFNPFDKESWTGTFHLTPHIEFHYDTDSFFEEGSDCNRIDFRFEWLIWTSWISIYYKFRP